MKYKKLWTDMHSNIHHDQMEALPLWYEQIKKEMDFWPIAYYPFYMRPTSSGLAVEDRYEDELIEKDWEQVRQLAGSGAGRRPQCIFPGKWRKARASYALSGTGRSI